MLPKVGTAAAAKAKQKATAEQKAPADVGTDAKGKRKASAADVSRAAKKSTPAKAVCPVPRDLFLGPWCARVTVIHPSTTLRVCRVS